jgi:Zn-dependent M28 family amino/carboxypeptidase
MSFFRILLPALLISLVQPSIAQKLKKSDHLTLDNLKEHIGYLADDKLEGRRAGTAGEALAMDYIQAHFKTLGLEAKGSDGFLQPFPINDGKQVNKTSFFFVNDHELTPLKDFFPLPFSMNASIEALPAIALREADMPWFVNIREITEQNEGNPHFEMYSAVYDLAREVKSKGASALILYNTSTSDDLSFEGKDKTPMADIPVIYIKKNASKKYFSDASATLDLKFRTSVGEKTRTGHNVIGYINNNATNTVILGAHYDHLGYGEDGNSMLRTGERLIHNGADDNASGTAALIELARLLKASKDKNNNYLFIAFSGEELGLFGSKFFVENPTIDLTHVNYMINMDMVGRLNDSSKTVTVGGFGTSPAWSTVVTTNKRSAFSIHKDSSGTGPSDHTSFYRKDIPVLFFFTGLHSDYHRPTDDADKINYEGEVWIIKYIAGLIDDLNKQDHKLAFAKTRETQTSTSARFSVTLGIMPDYTYNGSGVRIDGISDGKAAQKAGMKAGDIITQLGDLPVTSLESYMQALGKFKKGDSTKVKYKRGEQTIESAVQF